MKLHRSDKPLIRSLKEVGKGSVFGFTMLTMHSTSSAGSDGHTVVPARCFPLDNRPIERFADGMVFPANRTGAEVVCPLVRDKKGISEVGARMYVVNSFGDTSDISCILWSCYNQGSGCSTRTESHTGSGGTWLEFSNIPQQSENQVFFTCEFGFNDFLGYILHWEDW